MSIPLVNPVTGTFRDYPKVAGFVGNNPEEPGVPSITFQQVYVNEKTSSLGVTTKIIKKLDDLFVPFNPEEVFDLIDETGAVVGQFTALQYYQMTACIYKKKAEEKSI